MINPLDLLNADAPPCQDFIVLQGQKSPGRATVGGAKCPRKWDVQSGFGISGGSMTFHGEEVPVEFEVEIALWEDEHWSQWNRFVKLLAVPPHRPLLGTPSPLPKIGDELLQAAASSPMKGLSIQHPRLNRRPILIDKVVVRDVSSFQRSKTGLETCTITFSKWKPPRIMLAKVDGTIPAAGAPIDPFANDPQIKALMDKQKSLGGAL
jgi:hypothetical protein